jgi:hypothetical protein
MSKQELLKYMDDIEDLIRQAKALIMLDTTQLERANIRFAIEKLNDALQLLKGLQVTSVLA